MEHSFCLVKNRTTDAVPPASRFPSASSGRLPQRQFAQQRRQQRQLLVEFAQHGQPEQRVQLELQLRQRGLEQQQPLHRVYCAPSVPVALIHYVFYTLSRAVAC